MKTNVLVSPAADSSASSWMLCFNSFYKFSDRLRSEPFDGHVWKIFNVCCVAERILILKNSLKI